MKPSASLQYKAGGGYNSGIMLKLLEKLDNLGSPRIALLGDFMLDSYVYGDAERLSPEAPVPVLKVVRKEDRIGGAGNVAAAIAALGGKAACIGVRGEDQAGDTLCRFLSDVGADAAAILRCPSRATTVKTRHVGLAQHRHPQQMLRVDCESSEPMDEKAYATLRAAARCESKACKVLVIEDYDKGVLNDTNTPEIIADARSAGCMVIVDPARIDNYRRYCGATLLTPNRYEAELASGVRITDDASLERAARQVLLITEADAVLVTLDKEGSLLIKKDKSPRRIRAHHPRAVYDVSGAGDEVIAALSVALAEGWSFEQAGALANIAGGLEVEKFGVSAITRDEVVDELRRMIGLRRSKLLDRSALARELERRRASGQNVVFTNGCFDLLHMGHVRYLQQAREQGSCLVVAINSDASVRKLKGPRRPIIDQNERAEMLGALECVDYVTFFDEDTPEALLELLKPELLVKGGTTPVVVGQELVEQYGGRVQTLDIVEGLSTTNIIERVLAAHDTESQSR